MDIACIDSTDSFRAELANKVNEAIATQSEWINQTKIFSVYACSKRELLLGKVPDIVCIGPGYSVEDALIVIKEIKESFPSVSIIAYTRPDNFTIRNINRFKSLAVEVFSFDEPVARVISFLLDADSNSSNTEGGKLLCFCGAKGGVGTTTAVVAFAHAANALNKSCVVVDLSRFGLLLSYLKISDRFSVKFQEAILNGQNPTHELVGDIVGQAPNGIFALRQPAGGLRVREKWISDSDMLDFTLNTIEILKESYDYVLVDIAAIEGIMRFALLTRADNRVVVSDNTPASVHATYHLVEEISLLPSEKKTMAVITLTNKNALNEQDIRNYLNLYESAPKLVRNPIMIPHDEAGGEWVGTGNTFYTESKPKTQRLLREALVALDVGDELTMDRPQIRSGLFSKVFGKLSNNDKKHLENESQIAGALPNYKPELNETSSQKNNQIQTSSQDSSSFQSQKEQEMDNNNFNLDQNRHDSDDSFELPIDVIGNK